MIDTDDLDRLLRDGIASAADADITAGDPASRVATHVRRRRRRRTVVRASVAGAVTVLGVLAFALSRPASRTAPVPAHRPVVTSPSVLSTLQTPGDLFARHLFLGPASAGSAINWASVRLLQQHGSARVFGGRTTSGGLCTILVVPDSKGRLSSGSDCGPGIRGTTAQAAARTFAAHGSENFMYARDTSALGFFVPDAVRSATVDGVAVPVTRNGLLVVFTSAHYPRSVTLSSAKGTVTVSLKPDSDGIPNPTVSGSYE